MINSHNTQAAPAEERYSLDALRSLNNGLNNTQGYGSREIGRDMYILSERTKNERELAQAQKDQEEYRKIYADKNTESKWQWLSDDLIERHSVKTQDARILIQGRD